MSLNRNSNIYLIWWGIASLSSAVYLINNALVKGKQINIYDWAKKIWWSLDAKNSSSKNGYIMRWIRMFEEEVFTSVYDLMEQIPSLRKPGKNLREEFIAYNKKHKTYCQWRLLKKRKAIDTKPLGLWIKDRFKLFTLIYRPEKTLNNVEIKNYFTKDFFKTNFWYEFCTVFAFQPWHSLSEFRRYLLRFIHTLNYLDTLDPVEITPYNQYESLVLPIIKWLKEQWVTFVKNTKITNLDFETIENKQSVSCIHYKTDSKKNEIKVHKNDYVFVTIGSMIANSSNGSMNKAPSFDPNKKDVAWTLWEKISKNNPEFGNPKTFNSSIDKTKWIAYTITFKDDKFFKMMKKYIDEKVTSHGWVTIIDSNWFMSLIMFFKPYFEDQAKETKLCRGYSLNSDKKGNYVKKKMSDCNWEEILTELVYHLWFEKHLDKILKSAVCIPSMTPYVTSHFLPRKQWDRPQVVPNNSRNLAFLWQFCEIPKDIVFTVEYSIRSAQIAVKKLFNLNNKITPIYKWTRNIKVLSRALKTIFRK